MVSAGTQVISRKQLASANTPPYIKEVETLIEVALTKASSATSKEQKRTVKVPDLERALGILEKNSSGSPPVEHLLALAEVHWELENSKESIAFLKEAIQLAPKDARPYGLLGRYLMNKGLRDQAMNFLDRAIALDPGDVQSKKLRERAARQARKSYTVVVNAQDLAKSASDKKKNKAAAGKAEATRLLDVDALRAEQALEQAAAVEDAVENQLDDALAKLLATDLSGADVGILKPESSSASKAGRLVKTLVVFGMIGIIGMLNGAVFQRARPKSGPVSQTLLEKAIFQATPKSLIDAEARIIQDPEMGNATQRALVSALLYADFGHDLLHLDTAVEALSTLKDAEKKSPAGLLLRALVQRADDAEKDASLDDELQKAKLRQVEADDVLIAMARAERHAQRGDLSAATFALADQALSAQSSPRALVQLARYEAARGNLALTRSYIAHGLKMFPEHAPLLAMGLLLEDNRPLPTKKSKGKKAKAPKPTPTALTGTAKKADALLENLDIEGEDAALVALVHGALQFARGDDAKSGPLFGIVKRRGKNSAPLLNGLVETYLLRVQPDKAMSLLDDGSSLVDSSIPLLANAARAKLLNGLPDKPLRTLRSFSEPGIDGTDIVFPGGRFVFDPLRHPVPLRAQFDARYFPEAAVNHALDKRSLTPSVARRRLRNVADLKLAEILLAQGGDDNMERAEDHLKRVRKNGGDNQPEYYLVEARLYRMKGESPEALESIEAALDLQSDDPRVVLAAASIHLEGGNAKSALKALNGLREVGVRSPQEAALRSRALVMRGDLDDADRVLKEGRTFAPRDAALQQSELHLMFAQGNIVDARRSAKRLLRKKPGVARAMAERDPLLAGLLIVEEQKEDLALGALAELSTRAPDNVAPMVLRAVLLEKRDADEAKKLWQSVAERTTGPLADLALENAGEAPRAGKKKKKKKKKRRGRRRR